MQVYTYSISQGMGCCGALVCFVYNKILRRRDAKNAVDVCEVCACKARRHVLKQGLSTKVNSVSAGTLWAAVREGQAFQSTGRLMKLLSTTGSHMLLSLQDLPLASNDSLEAMAFACPSCS